MRIILSLIFLSSFFISCERDEELQHSPMAPPPAPDTIVYTDIPDFSLITVFDSTNPGVNWIPSPIDTTVSDSIDVDLDGIYDLKFTLKHWYYWLSASNPASNYGCSMSVETIQVTDTVAFYGTHYWWIADLYLNDVINNSLHYDYFAMPNTSRFISYQKRGAGPPGLHNFTGEKYLGFKMFRNNKTMFGWVRIESVGYNGVIVKDFAVNKTDGNDVFCGQQN